MDSGRETMRQWRWSNCSTGLSLRKNPNRPRPKRSRFSCPKEKRPERSGLFLLHSQRLQRTVRLKRPLASARRAERHLQRGRGCGCGLDASTGRGCVYGLDASTGRRCLRALNTSTGGCGGFSLDDIPGPGCILSAPKLPFVEVSGLLGLHFPFRDVRGSEISDMRSMMQVVAEHFLAVLGVLDGLQDVRMPELVHVLAQEDVFGVLGVFRQHGQIGLVREFDAVGVFAYKTY